MKRFLPFSILIGLLLAACGPVTPVPVPTPEVSRPDLEFITPQNVSRLQEISRWGRGAVILDQALSPDGKLLAIALTTGVYFYDANTLEQSTFNFEPDLGSLPKDAIVSAVVFSPNGKFIAYALNDSRGENDILIFSLDTGKIKQRIYHSFDSSGIESLQFSPDGNYLVVESVSGGSAISCQSGTKNIALYNVDDPFPLYNQYYCFHARVTTRFTSNNRLYIFTEGEQPYEMVIIETSTGNRLKREFYAFNYSLNSESVNKIYDVSADGLTFAAMQFTTNGLVYKLLDAATLAVLEVTEAPVRFTTHPNYRWIDHHIEPWELQTIDGKSVCIFDTFFGLPSLFPSNENTGLSFGIQELNLWDLSTCQSRKVVLATIGIQDFAISPNGKTFAYQDFYSFYLQDATSGKILPILSKPRSLGYYNLPFAFSADEKRVYVSSKQDGENYKIAEMDVATGEIGRFLAYEAKYLQRILVPNRERILFIENGRVEIWNLLTDKQIEVVADAWNVVFSPNRGEMLAGTKVLGNSQKGQLVRVDLRTGETTDVFPMAGVREARYISDTLVFVTQDLANNQENYLILNLETGEIESQLEQPADSEYGYQELALTERHVFLSFDNKYSETSGRWIQMRTVNNLPEMKLLGKISNFGSLVVSPDQRILASVSRKFISSYLYETVVQFWDAQTGEFLAEKQLEGVPTFALAHFSPDSRYIVLEGDGIIRLWGVPRIP